ncbi:MAG: tRNA (adenosine(37)-N6)-threonylcarbamoyltransferase complex dimerization subunit type 1 TsaB [Planctomycetota bacterium]
MAICLAISACNPGGEAGNAEVALVESGRALGICRLEPTSRHDDALLPAIEKVMDDAELSVSGLDQIVVTLGPGGFSATRIAVTTAACLAESHSISLLGVPTSLALAVGTGKREDLDQEEGLVVLAWKRQTAWVQRVVLGRDATTRGEAEVLTLDSIGERCKAEKELHVVIDPACAREINALSQRDRVWSPVFSAVAAARASELVDAVDPEELLPIYPREPEAVRKWRERATTS